MINILLPIAGQAKRFQDVGYSLPKPLIPVNGVPMIKLALDSLLPDADPKDYRLIFVVRSEHEATFDICGALRHLFRDWTVEFASVDHLTKGTLCSCLVARELIRPDEPLVIYTPDVCFEASLCLGLDADGFLLTFKANSPDHSYVALDENGYATRTAEKVVISNDSLVGVYGFRSGAMFLDYADEAIASGETVKGEYYVAPMYNLLIRDGLKIVSQRAQKMYVLGTPEDLNFYEAHVARYSDVKTVALCCDHSGFALKEALVGVLKDQGVEFVDFGTYSPRDSDHYDSLKPCAEYLLNTTQAVGIGICQTGQGFNIGANKVKGLRSVLITDVYGAEMGRRHNAANFFCLPARSVQADELSAILRAILENSFDGGRHATRIRRISADSLFST